jgi:oxygen-independent coproporphyrinogen-3 oxidase
VVADISGAEKFANEVGGRYEREVDSIYLGGGTPTVLETTQLERIFDAVRRTFDVTPDAEVTVEVAPGTLNDSMLETLLRCGVNRVSLGVQSFVDEESRSVGRLHTRAITLDDIARLRAAGIANISIDLIAGLPHQTRESWGYSLEETIATGVPHISVYMLEVDEDSRLGSELIAGGTKYHAHFVPDDDTTAELYERAVERLNAAGIGQYEISNFARAGCESRHNLKYWTRDPYIGFGVDAHSMLPATDPALDAVRFATSDALEEYVAGKKPTVTIVDRAAAAEEEWFLGLRLNQGVQPNGDFSATVEELARDGLVERIDDRVRLTARGRLLSNEVFQRFIGSHEGPSTPLRAGSVRRR